MTEKSITAARRTLAADKSFAGALRVLTETAQLQGALPDIEPFEQGLREKLAQYGVKPPQYNVFDYAPLLDSGLEFLLRAVALRDDGKNLALRAANDLIEAYTASYELEAAQTNLAIPARADSEAQRAYVEALSSAYREIEPKIKPKSSRTEDLQLLMEFRRLGAELNRARAAQRLADDRIDAGEQLLEKKQMLLATLARRRTDPGNALNMNERIGAAREAFLQNVCEAYARLQAASIGLRLVFGDESFNTTPPPESQRFNSFPAMDSSREEIGYVDKLLAWVRETLFVVERNNSRAVEVTMVFSLNTLVANNKGKKVPGNPDSYELTLRSEDFNNLRQPRLTSVRLHSVPSSFALPDSEVAFRKRYATRTAALLLPAQATPSDIKLERTKLCFGDVRTYEDAHLGKEATASSLQNQSPIGKWMVSPALRTHTWDKGPAPDFWLEVTVLGVPGSSLGEVCFDAASAPYFPGLPASHSTDIACVVGEPSF